MKEKKKERLEKKKLAEMGDVADPDEEALRRITALRLQILQEKMSSAEQVAAEVSHRMRFIRAWLLQRV